MSDSKCWCSCHMFDDDGEMRGMILGWRCPMCGAEPDKGDTYAGDEHDAIRRHVLENGRVVLLDVASEAERRERRLQEAN